MHKIYILLILVLMLGGCSSTTPIIAKYKLYSNVNIAQEKQSTCKDKNIKVLSAFSSASLMSKDMRYVHGNSKVYKYSESAWLNNPNRCVSRELIKMLRELDIYKNVQESKSRSKADLIVEITLDDFMQYYSSDLTSSYAVVQIHFAIIDTKNNTIVSSKTFKNMQNTKTLDAKGGVDALNNALKNVLVQSSKWFIKVCS